MNCDQLNTNLIEQFDSVFVLPAHWSVVALEYHHKHVSQLQTDYLSPWSMCPEAEKLSKQKAEAEAKAKDESEKQRKLEAEKAILAMEKSGNASEEGVSEPYRSLRTVAYSSKRLAVREKIFTIVKGIIL